MDSFLVFDHLQDFTPRSLWSSPGFTWMAASQASPHAQTDAFAVLGSLAWTAGRVRLGTGVTEPLRRHPVVIAQWALTLAIMTRRAPIVGIGSGEWMNTEPYGIAFDRPVSRLEEALEVLRACFDGPGSIDHSGRYYRLENAPFDLEASGRRPEIWVAAQGPRMLEIAGRFADGWLPAFAPSPTTYERALAQLTAAARTFGRDPHAITPSLQVGVVVAPNRKEAESALRSSFVRFHAVTTWSASTWQSVGLEHPFGPQYRGFVDIRPELLDLGFVREAMAEVPDELLQSGFLWGTVDDVVTSIRALGDAGLRHISLLATSYPVSKRLANYFWWAIVRITRRLRTG